MDTKNVKNKDSEYFNRLSAIATDNYSLPVDQSVGSVVADLIEAEHRDGISNTTIEDVSKIELNGKSSGKKEDRGLYDIVMDASL